MTFLETLEAMIVFLCIFIPLYIISMLPLILSVLVALWIFF